MHSDILLTVLLLICDREVVGSRLTHGTLGFLYCCVLSRCKIRRHVCIFTGSGKARLVHHNLFDVTRSTSALHLETYHIDTKA
jgi:hypothetical protein